jgi:hypothetical protein
VERPLYFAFAVASRYAKASALALYRQPQSGALAPGYVFLSPR